MQNYIEEGASDSISLHDCRMDGIRRYFHP